jgi:hypothetical protein
MFAGSLEQLGQPVGLFGWCLEEFGNAVPKSPSLSTSRLRT